MKNTENYGLNKPESTDYYNVDDFNENMDIIDEKLKKLDDNKVDKEDGKGLSAEDYTTEEKTKLEGIEAGAQANIAINEQAPTYEEATELSKLTTGEKLSIAFGKIAKAISSLISHIADTTNPHKVTKAQIGLGNAEDKSSETIRGEITSQNVTNALGYTPLNSTLKGANSGLAELDENGKVLTSQLPSYVDDVLEYSSKSAFPTTGESGKIYIATDTNLQYRWSGSAYVEISSSLALGETSSTAYRGDRGATAYAHSQMTSGNPHGVTKSDVGLGNVPNVATNDQTPTYTANTDIVNITSGETLSTAFAKIAGAIKWLITHLSSKSNPHGVTASQVGLGNCDNTADIDKPVSTATQEALDEIKNSLEWVLLGNTKGSTELTLPTDLVANKAEICVSVILGNSNTYIVPIKFVFTGYNEHIYRSGYYANSGTNGMGAIKTSTDGTISLYSAYLNNSDVLSTTSIYVRYRKF